MNKKVLNVAFVAAIALVSGLNVFNSHKAETLSDVVLANVEALAIPEMTIPNRTPSDTYKSMELLGNGCVKITYERLCAYGGSWSCTQGVFTKIECL